MADPSDLARDLALAVVAASTVPLLLLDGEAIVVAASASFCRAFAVDPDQVTGRVVYDLGSGEWDIPRLRSLLAATLTGDARIDAYEIDLRTRTNGVRRLVLNAQLITYTAAAPVRLLLTVSDVTEARLAEKLKDDLVRDKAVLLREVQHRVANSLQIIASVLMQSARKTASDEARSHLHDAHNRVMSIAAVQAQLAQSGVGEVALKAYLTQLCESIGASMIEDHDQLAITVRIDDSMVKADTSISLGLVVTELVINALKHAFPAGRHGAIDVDYRSEGANWTLAVRDDGVGMPAPTDGVKAGLGTSIVEALARQLDARIIVADARPGTRVALDHRVIAAVEGEPPVADVLV
jgi:two-component sensor histidine kinase